MHLLCAIVQRVGWGPPPATIDYTRLVAGDWGGSAAQISVEQFSEAPQRGYWLRPRLRGASVDVDVDTSVWRRRKWARLWWRHDPWGDAATAPAPADSAVQSRVLVYHGPGRSELPRHQY